MKYECQMCGCLLDGEYDFCDECEEKHNHGEGDLIEERRIIQIPKFILLKSKLYPEDGYVRVNVNYILRYYVESHETYTKDEYRGSIIESIHKNFIVYQTPEEIDILIEKSQNSCRECQ